MHRLSEFTPFVVCGYSLALNPQLNGLDKSVSPNCQSVDHMSTVAELRLKSVRKRREKQNTSVLFQ
jgi:hypothetical protein